MMEKADCIIDSLKKAVLCWYEFQPCSNLLVVTDDKINNIILERNENLNIYNASIKETVQQQFLDRYWGFFDAVIAIKQLEKSEQKISVLKKWCCLLKESGKLLLGVDNRLGLRFFCGERDPYTHRCFDGIENYKTCQVDGDHTVYEGRCFSKQEWISMLKQADIACYKFYSIFPNLEALQLVYASDYFPNENLLVRYMPRYDNSDTVYLKEESILSGISNSELFHLLANAYIIECPKDHNFLDIRHVSVSMNRGWKYACMTKIREKYIVDKEAVFAQGNENIRLLNKNMQDLKERGICIVEGELIQNCYRMAYMEAPTGNEYLYSVFVKNKEHFIKRMDDFRKIILQSSDSYADPNDEVILKRGYIDLVPLNCFWDKQQFVFFDQEYCITDLPANVILYRTIIIVYSQDMAMNRTLPMDFFWKRYQMEKNLHVYRRMESEFLITLRNQREMAIYDHETMRNDSISSMIKNNINGVAFYQELVETCFEGLEDKKVFLFGAGKYADKFLAFYRNDYRICSILDNDDTKWGSKLYGIPIASPESIVGEQEAYKVIICAKQYGSIFKQLKYMQVINIGIYDAHYIYPGRQNLHFLSGHQKKYGIGYISGVFDLYHIGHLNMFRRAKEQCEYLIAAVTSDEYVRIKKQREPYIPFSERLEMVRACKYVDEAVEIPFQYGGTVEAFQKYHFDCQFCGSDYADDPWWLEQKAYLQSHGSDLVFFPYTIQTSSSKIKELIEKKLL